jgi:hypothetical protein
MDVIGFLFVSLGSSTAQLDDSLGTPPLSLIQSGNCPLAFNYTYESMFYEARVSFEEGIQIKEAENHNEEFKKIFVEKN